MLNSKHLRADVHNRDAIQPLKALIFFFFGSILYWRSAARFMFLLHRMHLTKSDCFFYVANKEAKQRSWCCPQAGCIHPKLDIGFFLKIVFVLCLSFKSIKQRKGTGYKWKIIFLIIMCCCSSVLSHALFLFFPSSLKIPGRCRHLYVHHTRTRLLPHIWWSTTLLLVKMLAVVQVFAQEQSLEFQI